MRRPIRITLFIVGTLGGLVALLFVAGLFFPREHVATSEITLRRPIDSVYTVLRDLGNFPKWWSDVTLSERVSGVQGERWKQEAGGMSMQLDVVDEVPPLRLVTRIVEEKGAVFGGTWTYMLTQSASGGTVVSVTEQGWIGPPPFRVIQSVMGMHGTLDGMLTALGKHFGESVTPAHR